MPGRGSTKKDLKKYLMNISVNKYKIFIAFIFHFLYIFPSNIFPLCFHLIVYDFIKIVRLLLADISINDIKITKQYKN